MLLSLDECTAGMLAWVELALEKTGLHNLFREVEEACLGSDSEKKCNRVSFEIDSLIAEAPAVVSLEPEVSPDEDFEEIENDVLETTIDVRKPIRGNALGALPY